ncbi:MAG TPA: outer membrane beta-barrel protein, partial [Pseudoxanthomonas sp.]|nr:outer membrane beta-barrel protein [Pseudoxanthomonas sp.]
SSLASVDIELEAGYSRIEPMNYDGDSSSPLFRGNVEWRVAPRTILSAGFLYEFSDAAQNLIVRREPTDLPPVDDTLDPGLQIGPQTFRQRRVMLGYYFNGERFTFQLNPYYERIRYLTASSENQDVRAVNAALDWRLRPGLNLSLAAVRQERKYDDIFRDDTSTIVNVSVRRELSRHWTGRAYLQRTERVSSSASQNYTENSVMVTLTYRR